IKFGESMTLHYNRSSEKQKRKELRKEATEAERILWQYLRGKQLGGFKFRRQYSIDAFVIDFYCPEVKLAVEVDGPTHFTDDAQEYDSSREEYIKTFGVTFLRFTNVDVYQNIEGVLTVILARLNELKGERQPPPNPLLAKEGERPNSAPDKMETNGSSHLPKRGRKEGSYPHTKGTTEGPPPCTRSDEEKVPPFLRGELKGGQNV
ncbi:MAG: endonuclease domain-containing protein, partial [bacterium]